MKIILSITSKYLFPFFILVSFISCERLDNNIDPVSNEAEVTINFLYFTPYRIQINSTIDGWATHNIWQPGTNTFKYTYNNVTGTNKMSIKFAVQNTTVPPDFYNLDSVWVNGGGGIAYADVKINGVSLNYQYAIDNGQRGSDIIFKLNSDGTPAPSGLTPVSPDERVQPEAAHGRRTVINPLPPPDKPYMQAWFQALQDHGSSSESTVEVKNIRVYAYLGNSSTPTLLQNYTYTPGSTFYDGGLFYRYPFFLQGRYDYHSPMTTYANINSSGNLVFHPSYINNKVWHWWNEPRISIPNNATGFRVESEMIITGSASVQAGLDFKSSTAAQGDECGAGEWKFGQPGWQTVVFDSKYNN
ncbi:MAG: hypothetical protein JST55_11715 [Bacteroidetes bacterium]|nr:hypothetical protein [Bacteroidota bacterium]